MKSGYVFDIQHFSLNNGPGIRTTVFFKGCPLQCIWCHNPESSHMKPEIKYVSKLCKHCGACISVCPNTALYRDGNNLKKNLAKCNSCGKCAQVCNTTAMELCGKLMSSDEVVAALEADRPFYETSGGGATISGGEPTMQYDFLCEVLEKLKAKKIHTTVDTSGFCEAGKFQHLLQLTDHILFDIKDMSEKEHKAITGVSNVGILKNLKQLFNSNVSYNLRYPMIPGYNDSDNNISRMCEFLCSYGISEIDISVFNDYYREKYIQMFRPESIPKIEKYTDKEIERKIGLMNRYGITGVLV